MDELIEKAKKGDKESFTKLILEIKDDLYKIARSRIYIETDIDDAVQETMIEAFKLIKKLKDNSKFKKWIIKILINKCNRIYRRKYKKDVSIDEYNLENFAPTNDYKKIEDELNFYSLIKNLKYEERLIIILYYKENYSVKEIKEMLHIKENMINTHLYRARQKLRKILSNNQ